MASYNIHATCVMLAKAAPVQSLCRAGVLFLGASGSGKSDLALRLIEQGALLVSDDRTELFVTDGKLQARAAEKIAGLLEVRGLGIIEVPHEKSVEISLVAELVSHENVARLPQQERYTPPAALEKAKSLPLVRLFAFEPSATAKIRWAALAFGQSLFRD